MALSAAQMQEAIIRNLPQKTGKSLEEWLGIAASFKLSKNADVLHRLKSEYGLGHVQAQTIVWRLRGENAYIETSGYEEEIFKTTLDAFQKLKQCILLISSDIVAKPCKTYVAFYARTQFAVLTEKKGKLILGMNLVNSDYSDLHRAQKLGGSQRINYMIEVNEDDFGRCEEYLVSAYEVNR